MKPKTHNYFCQPISLSKTLINFLIIFCFSLNIHTQNKNIKTESVTIEKLIPFIIENYANVSDLQHITLLIETTAKSFSDEETFLLKQAVNYLSDKLTEEDSISIAAYNMLNGIALEGVPASNFKKIFAGISNLSKHLNTSKDKDGISLTYQYVNETAQEDITRTIIMVRNPNGSKNRNPAVPKATSLQSTSAKKQNGNMVLLTAIAVLPELISIIKD